MFDLSLIAELAAFAVALGLGLNRLRTQPLPLVYTSPTDRLQQSVARLAAEPTTPPARSPSPAPPAPADPAIAAPETIDLDRFHALTEDPACVVLDARPALFYRVGHVPGAHPLSRAAFEGDYAALRPLLESHRQNTLAVYCAGGECEDSHLVADALGRLGYPQVVIYAGGWEEWRGAGLPEEKSR